MHRTSLIAALLLAGCATSSQSTGPYAQSADWQRELPPVPPEREWQPPDPRLPVPFPDPDIRPPHGDALGDVWEEEEENQWRGTWIRRGQSGLFDAYWVHPTGERVLAVVDVVHRGREVKVDRRHADGQSCTYRGTISGDWLEVSGWYGCSWHRHTSPWHARIVRMRDVSPALLAGGGWRRTQ